MIGHLVLILQLTVIFFLVLHVLLFIRKNKVTTSKNTTVLAKYSILIAASNEERYIESCLDNIKSQNADFVNEIIIVVNNSTDDTFNIVKGYDDPRILVIQRDSFIGKSSAVILGLTETTNNNVFLLDSDTHIRDKSLYNLASYKESTKTNLVIGIIGYLKQAGWQSKILEYERYYTNNFLQKARGEIGVATLHGSFSLIDKDVYLKFQKEKILQDDLFATYSFTSNGYKIKTLNVLVAEEEDRSNLGLYILQRARWIIGNIYITRLYVRSFITAPGLWVKVVLFSYPLLWYLIYYVIVFGYIGSVFKSYLLISTATIHITYFIIITFNRFQVKGFNFNEIFWIMLNVLFIPLLTTIATVVAFIMLILKLDSSRGIFYKRHK